MPQLQKIFEPIKFGQVEVKNRLVMSAIGGGGGYGANDRVTPRLLRFYEERAQGGVGLIVVGMLQPIDLGRPNPRGVSIYKDELIPSLRQWTDVVHKHDAKIGVQLSFGGTWWRGGDAPVEQVGPSDVVFVHTPGVPKPRPLTIVEIHQMIEALGEATRRAREAGFDCVEYQASTGAIFGQFLSPLTNQRTDQYGGSFEKRMRFLLDVIASGKEKAGNDYTIIVRLGGADFMEGGNTHEDSKRMAPILEKAGIHCLNVTTGWHEAPVPFLPMSVPRGAYVYLGESIKKEVSIPVIGGTRINDPLLAEQIVAEGKLDMVYLCRPLIADPEFVNKAKEGRLDDICPCIACSHCFGGMGTGIECTVNPRAGRELEYTIESTQSPKKVFVIGGGPAGMEAAIVAAARGHKVTLAEKGNGLGGQLLVAALPPYKEELANFNKYLANQVHKQGVEVKLNEEVTLESIEKVKPDAVIVATGATPIIPDIPGATGSNVATAIDVLTGRKETGQNVIIIGGGSAGCETAEFLIQKGKKVTILEMLDRIGNDFERSYRWVIMLRLREAQVRMETDAKAEEITERGVGVSRKGETEFFEGDSVVLAMGMKADNSLAGKLEGKVAKLYTIGDCAEPHRILEAIHSGFRVAREI